MSDPTKYTPTIKVMPDDTFREMRRATFRGKEFWFLPEGATVRFYRLPHGKGLPLPAYATAGAAGMDLPAAEGVSIQPGDRALVSTGFLIEIPQGYEGQVRPRSGLALKYGVTVLNAPGTIDADFRGELKVILVNHSRDVFDLHRGDRIAQLVIAPVARVRIEETEQPLSVSERGEGGFGSSGR